MSLWLGQEGAAAEDLDEKRWIVLVQLEGGGEIEEWD